MNFTCQTLWRCLVRMLTGRAAFVVSRLVFGGFIFFTAFYCLLFYVPFSRHALFDWNVITALSLIAHYHAPLYWLAFLPVCLTIVPYLKEPALRRATIGFVLVLAGGGIWISINPLLTSLPPDDRSLVSSLVSLFPLWWIAVLDWKAKSNSSTNRSGNMERFGFQDVPITAGCVASLYFVIFALRYVVDGEANLNGAELLFFVTASFAFHVLLFGMVFWAFRFVNGFSARISRSEKLAIVLRSAMVALALAVVLRKVVFVTISFNDRLADFSAVMLSGSFVSYAVTSLLRFRNIESGQRLQIAAPLIRLTKNRMVRGFLAGISMVALAAFAYLALVKLQGVDWDGLLERMSVLLSWLATVAILRTLRRPQLRRQYSFAMLALILVACAGLYFTIQIGRPGLAKALRQRAPGFALLVERYADYDPSFGVVGEVLSPSTVDVLQGSDDDPFFAMLRENTNIPPEVKVAPVEINLVENLQPKSGKKPNIFIFAIDSLRQDYLSPYNQAVQFTPAIEAFAAESVVMRNAFTRYGGTGLAEPSIWSGGMQVHKQAVTPFYPMNSLQRLIDAEHYRSFITIDPVLKSMLRPSADIVELDKNVDWKDYDLVKTLSELQTSLAEADTALQPIFVYSQPQNLHLVSLKGSKRRPPVDSHYKGFAAQHAFEMQRIDTAFGNFIQFLKSRGMYDDSIIVLTSDHGDALGEGGHWGHGHSIYPEVIRIPLIMHLPERLKHEAAYDPKAIAFSTDITPTLYYLLGHRPIANNGLFGRPLVTMTMAEQTPYLRDSYLIVDSYGPVYGILRDNGRELFVADAARNTAYVYDLSRGYGGKRINVTDEMAGEYQDAIALEVKKIQTFYNYQPARKASPTETQSSTLAQLFSLLFSK